MSNQKYAEAVDEAIDRHRSDSEINTFSLRRAFRAIVADLMEEDGCSYEDALEFLAEEDYVVPVTTAMCYSVDAGETDIERLSTLVRNRAKRLLRAMHRT